MKKGKKQWKILFLILKYIKRTATMICSEDTHLLALSKKGFDIILGIYK